MSLETDTGLTMQEEDRLLSELKAYAQDKAPHDNIPTEKNSVAADASGVFGKVAAAIASERGMGPDGAIHIMKETPPALNYDEGALSETLHSAAKYARDKEVAEHGGRPSEHSVAARLQSAVDKFDRAHEAEVAAGSPAAVMGRGTTSGGETATTGM